MFGISAFGLKKLNICPLGQLHKDENVAEPKLRSKKRDVVYIPVNKSFVRQLIAAAAIIILLLMISTPMSEMKTTSDYASLVSSELFENGKDGEIEINDIVSLQQGNDSVIAAENNFLRYRNQSKTILKLLIYLTVMLCVLILWSLQHYRENKLPCGN